jgi:enoyl-CoA hydratase/carnithine racemase
MPSETLRVEITDGVALLTLNRPESLNALNRELFGALGEALQLVRDDEAVRVAVITGTGRAFCAGADMKERSATGAGAGGLGGGAPKEMFVTTPAPSPYTFDPGKPVIAAVNGIALGGGMEVALACDLRIAAESARLGLPEITRGFFPGGGGPVRLPRAIPRAVAMDMLLTGEPLDAAAALRWGLVSRVVPDEALLDTAMSMARRIASFGPLAVRAARELAHTQEGLPFAEAMRLATSLRWIIGQTADAAEGPAAFSEKREPQYRGE